MILIFGIQSSWHTFLLERSFGPIYNDPGRVRLLLATVGLIPAQDGEFEYYADFEDSGGEPLLGWAIAEHVWRLRCMTEPLVHFRQYSVAQVRYTFTKQADS